MKIGFAILVTLHGLIHLMGFAKAFQLAEIEQLTLPISKAQGLFWLMGLLLFTATVVLFLWKNEAWWVTGLVAVLVSQVLIIIFWKDAKFGTLANLIILVPVVIAFYSWRFDRTIENEVSQVTSKLPSHQGETITRESLEALPPPVRLWLTKTGVVGKDKILSAKIHQKGKLRTSPEQKWMDFTATHHVTTDDPAFIWKAEMKMNPLLSLAGRDKFVEGKGSMLIKLLSIFNVANASGNEKINQGSLQRFLAEVVWYPTAALNTYIRWEAIDSTTAKATMTVNGTSGTGVFHFHKDGTFDYFQADRYMGSDENAKPEIWHIQASENKIFQGFLIPTKYSLTWRLASGDFHWMELEVTGVEYL